MNEQKEKKFSDVGIAYVLLWSFTMRLKKKAMRYPMNHVYLFGHRQPDTDSIASVIGYAEFKNPSRARQVHPGPVRRG